LDNPGGRLLAVRERQILQLQFPVAVLPGEEGGRMITAETLADDELFLMVNMRGRSTGLPMNIWIGPRGHARHAARIKVQQDHSERFDIDNLAVVSVEEEPPRVVAGQLDAADLDLVRRYIALNRAAILEHWHEQTDGAELTRALRRLA
jgi:hypothetical protein